MSDLEPALVERMVALTRRVAAHLNKDLAVPQDHWTVSLVQIKQTVLEADDIVSLLPEPVDPDLIEAERIARDSADDFITPYPPARLERLTSHIYAAIKLGRELQKAETSHD